MRSSLGRFHRPFARVREEQLLLLNDLGDGSTLSLDFTTGVLNPRLTFTRSTTGTFIGANGLVQSAAIDVPRFDYDPATLAPRGLLIEGSAVNPILYSQDFSQATWIKSNATATLPTVAPDGTTTAYLLTSSTAGGLIYQTHAPTGTAASTYSIYVKQGTAAYCDMYIYDPTAAATRLNVKFTFATKSFTTTIGTNPSYQELKDGWFRLSVNPTALSLTNNIISYLYVGFAVAGTTYYAWGAQLEAGTGASSYIPTGASQGSRAADSAVMSDIGPLNYSNTNGTLYWSGIINKQPTSFITLIGFMAATDQPTFETFGNGLSYFAAARGASLSTGGSNEAIRTYTLGTLIKYAASVDTITNPIIAVNLNGSATSTNKVGTGDLYAATRFVLGRQPVTPSHGTNYPSVTIANIKYWPTTKTATELAALTA